MATPILGIVWLNLVGTSGVAERHGIGASSWRSSFASHTTSWSTSTSVPGSWTTCFGHYTNEILIRDGAVIITFLHTNGFPSRWRKLRHGISFTWLGCKLLLDEYELSWTENRRTQTTAFLTAFLTLAVSAGASAPFLDAASRAVVGALPPTILAVVHRGGPSGARRGASTSPSRSFSKQPSSNRRGARPPSRASLPGTRPQTPAQHVRGLYYRHGAILLIVRVRTGFNPRR